MWGAVVASSFVHPVWGGGVVFSEVPSSPMIPAGNFCWTFTTEGGKEVSGAQEPPVTAETESV